MRVASGAAAASELTSMASMSVPTIDLVAGAAGIAAEVRRACEEVGFLTVVGHGVDAELIDEVAARAQAFFDLPDSEKERFRAPAATPGLPVYRPLGAEKLGANADRKTSLDWGPSLEGVGWPSPELRDVYERYYGEMLRVAGTLMRSFALALGLDEHELDRFFDDRSSSLRVIDYPAGAGGARAGAHRDYGCLTIIRSDAGGLEVQTRSGEWLPVQASAAGFVVNIGDLMQRWTGDRWVSTLHRVVGAEGVSPRRQSLVFFHNPRNDAVIETLGDGTRYDAVTAGEYVLARAAEAGL
jgi:isopenicillin N synthase-like dioxygenase